MSGSKMMEGDIDEEDMKALEPGDDDAREPEAGVPEPEQAAEEPKRQPPDYVPLAALHDERERRRQLKAELEDLKQQWQRGEQRLQQFLAAQQQPQEPPDPETRIANLEAWLGQEHHARQRAAQAEQESRQFVGRYAEAAREFERQTPDFMAAYQHLARSRAEELAMAGYPEEPVYNQAGQLVVPSVGMVLQNDERQIVAQAFRAEKNPAEVIYGIARARGYAPAAGTAPDTVRRMRSAQAARGLDGGDAPASETSLRALIEMDDDEFARRVRDGKVARDFKRLMA